MSEENVEIVRRLYANWERGNLDTGEFFDSEVEHSRIGSELPGIDGAWQGFGAFRMAMAQYVDALADLHLEAEKIIDLGEGGVLVLVRQTARGKTSGLPFDSEFGDLFTFRDGKILSYISYWDRAEALEAAGLSE